MNVSHILCLTVENSTLNVFSNIIVNRNIIFQIGNTFFKIFKGGDPNFTLKCIHVYKNGKEFQRKMFG